MFNLLARISDQCKMIDRWNYPEKEDVQFEGAWEPYVRDFDPTLNQNFMVCEAAPRFDVLNEFFAKGKKKTKLLIFLQRMHKRFGLKQKVSFSMN